MKSIRIIRLMMKSIIIIICMKFFYDYYTNNDIYFDIESNYLHWSSDLPAISLCESISNYDNFTDKKLNEINKLSFAKKTSLFQLIERPTDNLTSNQYDFLRNINISIEDIKLSNCTEIFQTCLLNGKEIDCCSYFLGLKTPYGFCFTTNSALIRYDVSKFKVSHFTKKISLNLSIKRNVQVYIHDPKDISFIAESKPEPAEIKLGSRADIIFTSREILADPAVYSINIDKRNCYLNAEQKLKYYKIYSKSTCIAECILLKQIERCNCTRHLYPKLESIPACQLFNFDCLLNFTENSKLMQQKCNCLPNCEEIDPSLIHSRLTKGKSNNITEVILTLSPPPTDRLIMKVKFSTLDAFVGFCCFTRIFTNISIPSLIRSLIRRKYETKLKLQTLSTHYSYNSILF